MYRICLLDHTGTTKVATLFKAVVRGWSYKISAEGTLTFSLPIGDTDATDSNLQMYRQVDLQRMRQDGTNVYETVWTGYIEAAKENGQYIDVICKGLLGLFKKRLAAENLACTDVGSNDAFGLLTTANSDSDTGVSVGTGLTELVPFTSDAVANTITSPTSFLPAGTMIKIVSPVGGLTAGTTYYITQIGGDGSIYGLSLTFNGSIVDITSSDSGTYQVMQSLVLNGIVDVFHAWELLAQAHFAEFEIDNTRHFNFVQSLGSDKTSLEPLRFRRDGVPGNNVRLTGIGHDGQPMANRIIGTSTANGGMSTTQNDTTSQAIYGVLAESKAFHEAQTIGSLISMTNSYRTQRANPLTDYAVEPILTTKVFDIVSGGQNASGLQLGDRQIGDLVTVDIVTENQNIQQARRIAEIDVSTDENYNEHVLYTLSKTGIFVTSAYLSVGSIQQMRSRISRIEALLS